jgi:O-antigen ligase
MANNDNTWVNGAAVVTAPQHAQTRPVAPSSGSRSWMVVTVAVIAVCTAVGLIMTPQEWAWEVLRILSLCVVMLGAFYFPVDNPKPSFVIWWIMLIAECIFFREGDANSTSNAYAGAFPTAAYGEAIAWSLCFLAVLLCSGKVRASLTELFSGDFKWITVFTLMCVGSCVYSPRPSLGFVWGFKLLLVTLLLLACAHRIQSFKDTVSFLNFTAFAYAIIVLQPVIIAAMRGEMFDEEGRMSTIVSPNALSPNAAILLLMAIFLFSRRKGEGLQKSAFLLGTVGLVVMILAGSKTGIIAAVVAGGLYYLLRGRLGGAFTFMIITGMLVGVLAITTPLGDYFHLYRDRQGAESFSGRTLLWKAAWPAIKAKPITGHGYMSTEFIAFTLNGVGWTAPHLHNGFIEAAYSTGAIGFLSMMAFILLIPWRLTQTLRRVPSSSALYRVAAGCMALYVFLIINGMFNSSFGGKPTSPFMLLIALVVVSNKLAQCATDPSVNGSASLRWHPTL